MLEQYTGAKIWGMPMQFCSRRNIASAMALMALAGCASHGELVVDEGVGVTAVRTACPAIGIPDYTGDMTLLRDGDGKGGAASQDIDVVAAMTNVRAQCDQAGIKLDARQAGGLVHSTVSFDVLARRTDTRGARDVALPYFITVMRGGNVVIAKSVGTVTMHFADGEARGQGHADGTAIIDKAEATLNRAIRDRITKKRRAGEADAASDPLADPDVKAAVARATFEVLVGFQLNDQQLAYNATR